MDGYVNEAFHLNRFPHFDDWMNIWAVLGGGARTTKVRWEKRHYMRRCIRGEGDATAESGRTDVGINHA